jgi:hypothetical protein
MYPINLSSLVRTVFLLILLPSVALAKDQSPTSVSPLGYTLGSANRADVEKSLHRNTTVKPNGTNRYSGGPMLLADGAGLGVDGLQSALFIFDSKETLVTVQLTLNKGALGEAFDRTYERLAAKYKLARKAVPFVGDKYARFEKGDAVIELSAPHLSFGMTVTYMTRGFEQAFKALSTKDAQDKEKHEGGQF